LGASGRKHEGELAIFRDSGRLGGVTGFVLGVGEGGGGVEIDAGESDMERSL
jgi:hypothetical protein